MHGSTAECFVTLMHTWPIQAAQLATGTARRRRRLRQTMTFIRLLALLFLCITGGVS